MFKFLTGFPVRLKRLCGLVMLFYEDTRLIFVRNLRTVRALAEEQSLKFSIQKHYLQLM